MEIQTNTERITETVPEKLDYILDHIKSLDTKIDPIVDAYDSVLLGKKFIVGIGGFIAIMIAFGTSILWVANFIKHTFF